MEKGNDKDLFDTFIQKMAKKDLNDIGVISINLEMIYNGIPQYITLHQVLIFYLSQNFNKMTKRLFTILSKCDIIMVFMCYLI